VFQFGAIMAQKAGFLFFQIEQTQAQPVRLGCQGFQVGRAVTLTSASIYLAQVLDRRFELAIGLEISSVAAMTSSSRSATNASICQ